MNVTGYILFFVGLLFSFSSMGQSDSVVNDSLSSDSVKEIYVQISGVIVTGEKMAPVPFVNVLDKTTYRGTSSDYYGFFSFVGMPGDTLIFSSVGFKKSRYIIPDTLKTGRYSLIQSMDEDTIMLAQADIYPWPTREQFKDAFLNTDIPNDALTRAQNNLNAEVLAFKQEAYPAGGSLNYKWQMNDVKQRLYYGGQAPPNNLLNPIAWSKFIQAWKNGDFKSK